MGRCRLCGLEAPWIPRVLGVCRRCLLERTREALEVAREAHRSYRVRLGLPPEPPRESGRGCSLCVNRCKPRPGGRGYCGLWLGVEGGGVKPATGSPRVLYAYWYLDPHPTNCVATPVCPAATSRGYPAYTHTRLIERGYYNLAVFCLGCTLDCLFCQNWEHKTLLAEGPPSSYVRSVDELVEAAMDERVTCICYFGGDPTPQAPQLIAASRRVLRLAEEEGAVKRICWETNGLADPRVFRSMLELSIESGGIVKVDWKAWSPPIYEALTGVDGWAAVERLKENVKMAVDEWGRRPDPPPLVVSMLLVPGYVTPDEVEGVAKYLASLNPEIPLMLLAYHPDHLMRDTPTTSRAHAVEAAVRAREAGLKHVFIGNSWLLS